MHLFFRVLPFLFLLVSPARAEQALQLSSELGASATRGYAPPPAPFATPEIPTPAVPRLPDPSQEVRDELPPMPTIDLTTPPDDRAASVVVVPFNLQRAAQRLRHGHPGERSCDAERK